MLSNTTNQPKSVQNVCCQVLLLYAIRNESTVVCSNNVQIIIVFLFYIAMHDPSIYCE